MIFVDTNVISETMKKSPSEAVLAWLERFDAELALPTIAIGEIAFGIAKIHPDQRAKRLAGGLAEWRQRFAGRIFGVTEDVAMAYGDIMGEATRSGRPMAAQDGLIAATAKVNGGRLATRNLSDFKPAGLALVSPWEF